MTGSLVQLIILAAVAVFLVLRLRNLLGTRTGFEGTDDDTTRPVEDMPRRQFEVVDGGGVDQDIADHTDPDSPSGQALAQMKRVEPEFAVSDFLAGSRQAYEMILMAYENSDLETLEAFLAPDVYQVFRSAVEDRAEQGLKVEAEFIGVRELKLKSAKFDATDNIADITIRFVGEMISVVRNEEGELLEGDPDSAKKQTDIWTFSRVMGSENPNWLLVATGN